MHPFRIHEKTYNRIVSSQKKARQISLPKPRGDSIILPDVDLEYEDIVAHKA